MMTAPVQQRSRKPLSDLVQVRNPPGSGCDGEGLHEGELLRLVYFQVNQSDSPGNPWYESLCLNHWAEVAARFTQGEMHRCYGNVYADRVHVKWPDGRELFLSIK